VNITFTKTGLFFGTDHLPGEIRPCVVVGVDNVVYKLGNLTIKGRDVFDKMLQVIGGEMTQGQFIESAFGVTLDAAKEVNDAR